MGRVVIIRLVSVIAIAILRIRHVAYGWHQSQHSTGQRSTTRTSIFHPHTINIASCSLLLLLFSACHIFQRFPPFCFSILPGILYTFAAPLVACSSFPSPLPCTCTFSNFPFENVLINMHNLNFEVAERKRHRLRGRERVREGECCLRNLIAQSWFAKMQFSSADSRRNRLRYSQ